MARYRSIDEILSEEDDLGLLDVKIRARAARTPERERDAQLVEEANRFFDRHGRVPSPEASDHEEMRLGVIWEKLARKGPDEELAELVLCKSWLLRQKGAAAQHRKLRGSGGGGVVRSLVLSDRGRV